MRKLIGIVGLAAAALLAGCGGGGGSPGTTHEQYSITLRADQTSLPVNLGHYPAGIGVSAPFTTTLYVNAKAGDNPIPGGAGIFGCNISAGLPSGALYYLDGKSEHQDADGNPTAYRSITLDANSGGNSFHFHAGDQAGSGTITCTVTDPRDSQPYSASVNITVGGGAGSGMPASIRGTVNAPYVGSQFNVNNLRNNVGVQVLVMDDMSQPVPAPAAANVQVRILPTSASAGARLLLGTQSGSVVQAVTQGGVASFSLSSGPSSGLILLELTTDRADNNVANGLQDPIVQWAVVQVIDGISTTPLVFAATSLTIPNGTPYGQALTATGGTLPYSWQALGALPNGLTLSSTGVIGGTPKAPPGTYVVTVRVTDALGATVDAAITLNITGPMSPPLVFTAPTVTAVPNQAFSFALSASGGRPGYTWAALGAMPAGLTLSPAGVISGTPTAAGTFTVAVSVTDSEGTSVNGNVTITVTAPATP